MEGGRSLFNRSVKVSENRQPWVIQLRGISSRKFKMIRRHNSQYQYCEYVKRLLLLESCFVALTQLARFRPQAIRLKCDNLAFQDTTQ